MPLADLKPTSPMGYFAVAQEDAKHWPTSCLVVYGDGGSGLFR